MAGTLEAWQDVGQEGSKQAKDASDLATAERILQRYALAIFQL